MKKEFVYGHPMKYEHFTYDENSNSIFFSVIKSTNDSQRCLSGSCNIEKMQCTCGFSEQYKSLCCHMIKASVIIKKIEIFNLIPSYYKCNYSFEYSKINFHFPKVIEMDDNSNEVIPFSRRDENKSRKFSLFKDDVKLEKWVKKGKDFNHSTD